MTSALAPVGHDRRFRAMGSDFHVIVVGGTEDLVQAAVTRIERLEARWSRFRPDSELSRLNAANGRPVLVSDDTLVAVTAAVDAWRTTDGRFDPTVLHALLALGYDRDFAALRARVRPGAAGSPAPTPGCAGIEINATVGAIALPPGTAIDLGGIGKGLAADLVVAELIEAGAAGACVNAGGDLAARGEPPTRDGWIVGMEQLPDVRIALANGAVATSSSTKRTWTVAGTEMHHLLDPVRGRPSIAGLTQVTVLAAAAATAEVLAKAAFVAGPVEGATIIERAGATGLFITDGAARFDLPGLREFLR